MNIVNHIDWIYNLSLKMLLSPEAAEDACQEICEKALKKADAFKGESSSKTWLYRIAKNHLLDTIKHNNIIPWTAFSEDLHHYDAYKSGYNTAEEALFTEEIKTGCTTAMLQCLNPRDRLVFVMSTILPFSAKEAADICEIEYSLFRKIFSRAKGKIQNFLQNNCGLLNPDAACKCKKRIDHAIINKRLNPGKIIYNNDAPRIKDCIKELNYLDEVSMVYLNHPFLHSLSSHNPKWNFLKN